MIAAPLWVIGGGSVYLAYTVPDVVRGFRSRRWPRVAATVQRAEREYGAVGGGGKFPVQLTARWGVLYSYRGPGKLLPHARDYAGDRLRFGFTSPLERRRRVKAFSPGEVVSIAVNPRDYDDSVLIPGVSLWSAAGGVASMLIVVAGVVWLVRSLSGAAP